jgi:hypothetical protein
MPQVMVNMLIALPGTALWQRLEAAGRLTGRLDIQDASMGCPPMSCSTGHSGRWPANSSPPSRNFTGRSAIYRARSAARVSCEP